MCERRKLYLSNIDAGLAPGWGRGARVQSEIDEATLYYLLVGGPSDRILVDCTAPNACLDYLQRHGINPPRPVPETACPPGLLAVPWGWSRRAVDRFARCGAEAHHPPLDVVRRVNSRDFGHALARALGHGVPWSARVSTIEELSEFLGEPAHLPCVAKPMHGHSGAGLTRITSPRLTRRGQRKVRHLLRASEQGMVLEPLLLRETDLGTRFTIEEDGTMTGLSHHRVLTNASGVFFGVYLAPEDRLVKPWVGRLDAMAARAAHALYGEGYWGPVGIDSMVHRTASGETGLAAMNDINARQTMSTLAHALRRRLCPAGHTLFCLAPSRRYSLPASYPEWEQALGAHAFDPATQRGIFLFTPLFLEQGGVQVPPVRLGFFFAGASEEEVFALDSWVRSRFRKGWAQRHPGL